ncbi:MAG: NAD(P)/FAD-dependent oxidoreductase [Candidatus Diapherotrites archaeon]
MKYRIIGAGPAGLSAAITLAREGYKVDVFEQTSMVGGHTGNNIQAMRNYGPDKDILGRFKKEASIDLKHVNSIYKIVKFSPSHRFDEIYSKDKPLFYTFKRGVEHDSLENQLAEQARSSGVNILLGTKANVVDGHVVACGSKFGPSGRGFGALYENSDFDEEKIVFFFGNKYVPHGYAYIAPFGKKQVTIAITSFVRSDFAHMEKNFNQFVANDEVVKKIIGEAYELNRFSGYGHINIPHTAVHKHKYFVGGAAGFVDPARGFGIKYAIISGLLAAKAIVGESDYDDLWKNDFKNELLEGFNRRMLLNNLKIKDYEKFVEGKKISIGEYEKVPSSLKKLLLQANGAIKLMQWRKDFDFEKLFHD